MSGYSSAHLEYRRPPKLLHWVQALGGLLVLLLAVGSVPFNYAVISQLVDFLMRLQDRGVWDYTIDPLVFGAYTLAAIIAAVYYVRYIFKILRFCLEQINRGFQGLVMPIKPAKLPEDFRDYGAVIDGFINRTLSIYSPLDSFISGLFGENTMFLSPVRRGILAINASSLRKRLTKIITWGALLACPLILFALLGNPDYQDIYFDLGRELESLLTDPEVRQITLIPFILLLATQVFLAVVEFLGSMFMVPRRQPNTVATESSEHYRGFGHPTQIISRMHVLAEPLKWGEFDNRLHAPPLQEKASAAVGDAGTFVGRVLIEQQPSPDENHNDLPAYLFMIIGWAVTIIGYFLILFRLFPGNMRSDLRSVPFIFAPIFVFLMGLAARTLLKNGQTFVKQAETLLQTGRYRSIAILIELNGNLSRADVSVGKAETDSIGSSNVVVRSDFVARFWVAELVSESVTFSAKRELLALEQAAYAQEWIDYFTTEINTLREEGIKPVGLDFTANEVEDIVKANIAVSGMRKGAETKASLEPGEIDEDRTLLEHITKPQLASTAQEGSGDFKECPDCAEMVRSRARKCRFCGYRFDEEQE